MEEKLKVLIVDDDESIRELIQVYLKDDFQVLTAANGFEAIQITKRENPILMILDIMLPQMMGWEVCNKVRSFSSIPIIMVTAKNEEVDRIQGLELGADDYICKPFSPKELLARVKAHIRRCSLPIIEPAHSLTNMDREFKTMIKQRTLDLQGLVINFNKYKVTLHGKNIDLTTKEVRLLAFLAKHQGQVFSREQLLQNIWGFDYEGDSRAVDSAIKRLRKKLGNKKGYIHAVRSIGYKFEVGA